MSKEHPSPQTPRKMGIIMLAMAWGVLLVLLVAFFNNWLSDEKNPNKRPVSQSNSAGQIEVVLRANRQHHYVVNGQINGQEVVFLLDTGATEVVIPQLIAEKIGLQAGRKNVAKTANGSVTVYSTELDSITIGKIHLDNIKASINPAMDIEAVLLGMSALRKIEFTQRGNTLILRQ